jgi:hypothetical protein
MADDTILIQIRRMLDEAHAQGRSVARIELGRREYGLVMRAGYGTYGERPPDSSRLRHLWGIPLCLLDEDSALRLVPPA